MKAHPIITRRIEPNEDIFPLLTSALPRLLRERDLIIVTSKVISFAEERVVPCENDAKMLELIHKESDKVFEKEKGQDFWLTVKEGVFLPNAGIDRSNVPQEHAVLLPKDSQKSAEKLWKRLSEQYGVREFGVLIVDSRILPFRQGISGVAMGMFGFSAVSDERGKPDLFGKPLRVSQMAVADNLAAFAQLFFGQSAESCPFLLLENAPVIFTEEPQNPKDLCIAPKDDLFRAILKEEI
ncbi:coenzyme F420-0:L-glutamate ligase [Candidatus Peregrinibacteria bacterium]|nr:MAG: coenzyme F420-0:L-glutamate ligase [Candidatus Peregrinibacteria bacterium]